MIYKNLEENSAFKAGKEYGKFIAKSVAKANTTY